MSALLDSNPEYKDITVIRVTWDSFRDAPVTKELGVRTRSTLVMFSQGKEVGRVVSRTDKSSIEALFKAAI